MLAWNWKACYCSVYMNIAVLSTLRSIFFFIYLIDLRYSLISFRLFPKKKKKKFRLSVERKKETKKKKGVWLLLYFIFF